MNVAALRRIVRQRKGALLQLAENRKRISGLANRYTYSAIRKNMNKSNNSSKVKALANQPLMGTDNSVSVVNDEPTLNLSRRVGFDSRKPKSGLSKPSRSYKTRSQLSTAELFSINHLKLNSTNCLMITKSTLPAYRSIALCIVLLTLT